eukprot:gene6570-7870_t
MAAADDLMPVLDLKSQMKALANTVSGKDTVSVDAETEEWSDGDSGSDIFQPPPHPFMPQEFSQAFIDKLAGTRLSASLDSPEPLHISYMVAGCYGRHRERGCG